MDHRLKNLNVYLVGGAVRDQILGISVKDRDWVVTGSSPGEMESLGFRSVGKDFPVFLHPETGEEYALARTERKIGPGYHGFEMYSDASVTLEQDLLRRDLTINAIAQDTHGNFIDPVGGIEDINSRLLRHVSNAFKEDPVRVLRVARFAARFSELGFSISADTLDLMRQMTDDGEINNLVAERVWQELHSALGLTGFPVFIETLKQCHALAIILPELDSLFGIPQTAKYHPEIDTGTHILMALQSAIDAGATEEEVFAVLVHDLGKGLTPVECLPRHVGHEQRGLEPINRVCDRLRIPKNFRDLALKVCANHLLMHSLDTLKPKTILGLLEKVDAFRKPHNLDLFINCCRADQRGRLGFTDHPYPKA